MRSFLLSTGALSLALMLGCSSDGREGYTDPNVSGTTPVFEWPPEDKPLAKGALRIEGELVAFYDTQAKAGIPTRFKVFDATGADVTDKAVFAVRDPRFVRIEGSEITPSLGSSDPLGVVTMIGARVGDKVGFAYLVLVQQARTGERRDATAIVPANADAQPGTVTLKAGGGLNRVDVAIVMDTTGSMGGSIKDLVDSLATKILPELQRNIPDVAFGLVEHKDYPVNPYGDTKDFPVRIHKTMSTDVTDVRTALSKLSASGGSDLPESQLPAMLHALTGAELKWAGDSVPKATTPTGRLAPIGFRPGALPVVILVTDIDWHEPGHEPYDPAKVFDAPTMDQLVDAFKTTNARFVNVTEEGSAGSGGYNKETQANQLSDRTESNVPVDAFNKACGEGKCCTGLGGAAREPSAPGGRCRLNFLHKSGEGVSSSLINAIGGLSLGSIFDMTAAAGTATELPDGSKLIKSVKVMPMGHAPLRCTAWPTKDANGDGTPDTYVSVPVKSAACFEVEIDRNTIKPATFSPSLMAARIDVTGEPGKVVLDRRTIVFVVPPAP